MAKAKKVLEATTDHPAVYKEEGGKLVAGRAHDLRHQMLADAEAEDQQESIAVATTNEDLIKHADEMFDLKDEIDRLEAQAKQLKDRYDQLRKQIIPDSMKALNMVNSKGKGSFTFSRGKIHLEQKLYASCSEENKPLLFQFLRDNGDDGIIRETVNAQTLSAYVRERRGEGLADPPGASVHEEVTAKLTRSR